MVRIRQDAGIVDDTVSLRIHYGCVKRINSSTNGKRRFILYQNFGKKNKNRPEYKEGYWPIQPIGGRFGHKKPSHLKKVAIFV